MDIRLRSLAEQVVDIAALDMQVAFGRGEEMRTEISTKFAREGLEGIYARGRPRDGRLVDRPGRAVRALLARPRLTSSALAAQRARSARPSGRAS